VPQQAKGESLVANPASECNHSAQCMLTTIAGTGSSALSGPDLLILVRIAPKELSLPPNAINADWNRRQSITAGSLLGSTCHWCQGNEPGTVRLLVGHDDETWELAITLAAEDITRIVAAAEASTSGDPPAAV
jgi:hypothetical protein